MEKGKWEMGNGNQGIGIVITEASTRLCIAQLETFNKHIAS